MIDLLMKPHIGLIFWQTIVVLIAYWVLRKFAWGPILSFMEGLEKENEAAAEKVALAEKKLAIVEMKEKKVLGNAEAKSERILAKAMATKEALLAEAKIEAEKEKNELLQKAKQELLKEKAQALHLFKAEAGDLVVRASEKLLGHALEEKYLQQQVLTKMIDEALKEKQKKALSL